MLTDEQKKELDKDIQAIVDARVQTQVEEKLSKEKPDKEKEEEVQ